MKNTCEEERIPVPPFDIVEFLSNNIKWPNGIHFTDVDQAKAVAMFVIDTDGSIQNIIIIKHIAKPFDDEVQSIKKNAALETWLKI